MLHRIRGNNKDLNIEITKIKVIYFVKKKKKRFELCLNNTMFMHKVLIISTTHDTKSPRRRKVRTFSLTFNLTLRQS